MANAAKRMKEKKARKLREAQSIDMNIVEEYVEQSLPEINSGVVTNVVIFTEEELKNKLKSELVEIAEELDLDASGTKAELIEKILEV